MKESTYEQKAKEYLTGSSNVPPDTVFNPEGQKTKLQYFSPSLTEDEDVMGNNGGGSVGIIDRVKGTLHKYGF